MNDAEFRRNLAGAETLKNMSDDGSFFEGYIRGLRRYYHGKDFGTEEEHRKWLAFAGNTGDARLRAKGEGYRYGLSGCHIVTPEAGGEGLDYRALMSRI